MLYIAFFYLAIGVVLAAKADDRDIAAGAERPPTPFESGCVRAVFVLTWLPIIAAILVTREKE